MHNIIDLMMELLIGNALAGSIELIVSAIIISLNIVLFT